MNSRPRHGHRRARAVATAAALVAVAPVGIGASAVAFDGQTHPVIQTISYQYVSDPPLLGAPVCDQGGCVRTFSFLGRTTGDLVGSFAQAGAGTRFADGTIYANSTVVSTATITRCGTGTLAMRSTGINDAASTSGEIVIVEGSGTGELTGITGTGKVIDGQADPSGNGGGTGTIVMRLRCTTHA
jgi:hypothetical protein